MFAFLNSMYQGKEGEQVWLSILFIHNIFFSIFTFWANIHI